MNGELGDLIKSIPDKILIPSLLFIETSLAEGQSIIASTFRFCRENYSGMRAKPTAKTKIIQRWIQFWRFQSSESSANISKFCCQNSHWRKRRDEKTMNEKLSKNAFWQNVVFKMSLPSILVLMIVSFFNIKMVSVFRRLSVLTLHGISPTAKSIPLHQPVDTCVQYQATG